MNKRIEELIEKSTEKVANEGKDMWIGRPHYRRVFNKEKFADLIIEEVVRFTQTEYRRNWDFSWRDDFTGEIQKHFGVEE